MGSDEALDLRTLVKLSRPGWWLVNVWLYLAPTGNHYEVFRSLIFWIGLIYVIFPLNLLVYGINDYTDVEIDKANPRKGNYLYGAKCTAEQMRELPKYILGLNVGGCALLALLTGKWWQMTIWCVTCFAVNLAYNVEPLRLSSKGPFELPCVVAGFTGVSVLGSLINDVPWAHPRYWAHMTFLVLRTQLWTELMDYEADAEVNRRTTSTLIGKRPSQVAVVSVLLGEAIFTFLYFDDWPMRILAVSGLVTFVALECVKGTDDDEKKKAMKSQNGVGFLLMGWIWYRGVFAGEV
eukprot:gnl/MRDRNA2_/MRDRNA2_164733_c0_seq1.p1 gnl/MRDRNA2_/MRDRNA2_164733_c0~~gnl/MRDRNA2_/MRDRNA2_164733_c0_seq1.p1  ORF type:complete len:293 (-),score=43.08 gnl/MRDRNA2_/MRDRNA2_164733_c0_seq1:11-889(-)